jgi:DNA-binding NarL/FixJ family response regulator
MEFKNEELVEREIEIAGYLVQGFSINHIAKTTGLTKKLLVAHIKNMMQKLKAGNMETLKKALKE